MAEGFVEFYEEARRREPSLPELTGGDEAKATPVYNVKREEIAVVVRPVGIEPVGDSGVVVVADNGGAVFSISVFAPDGDEVAAVVVDLKEWAAG